MKVIVLGAGVIGVTSAYFLARAGHDVTVVDRRPAAGLETSFANGAQISASHSEPWANPKTPALALKWLGRRNVPLHFPLRRDPAQWAFALRFLANCTPRRTRTNTERNWRLARYSRELHAALTAELAIPHDYAPGILHVYRDPHALAEAEKTFAYLGELGCRTETLNAESCVALEPALAAHRETLVGGVHCAEDGSGDCYKFCVGIFEACRALGVDFAFGTDIHAIATEGARVSGVATSAGEIRGDAYVVAAGSFSRSLVEPLGIGLPIYPAKGYSVTVPTDGYHGAPRISVTDEANRLVYSRLGERLRVAGTAAFTGYDTTIDRARVRSILDAAMAEFPDCGDPARAEFWTGLRPLMPDCNPLVGPTPVGGLYLNTGHGSLGWTMCCGSGKLLADLVGGERPDIDPAGLGLDRFDS